MLFEEKLRRCRKAHINDRKERNAQMPAAYKIAQGKSGLSYTKGMCVKGGKEREHNHTEKALPVQAMHAWLEM